ncbi:GSU2403 family nucleotidyltransferase fold protein [Rubrivivax sp. RP6-9]|uniref:GSU2403 family nucleotidyltransferase fold protein n=1 Tax=Rubrivivax sp. RP6-9 TaxID=3415750 RepID=UPI003CC664A2
MPATPLYRRLELNFHTQYAEARERARTEPDLLPGTPGSLTLRTITGQGYWYRRYKAVAGKEVEDFVCRQDDDAARQAMQQRIDAAVWMQSQVRQLRTLGMQVADKDAARLLVELHNRRLFAGGLVLVGTMAYASLLNDLGAIATAARTQDIDLARRRALKLAAPVPFLETVQATLLEFFPVPGLGPGAPSISVKRPGAEGLRIDVLVPGEDIGGIQPVPELAWHAQAVPFFDYLLDAPHAGAVLAGGHCIPANLPDPARFVWHKLYSSTRRHADTAKARKDLQQAAVLAAVLAELDDGALEEAATAAPPDVLQAAQTRLAMLQQLLAGHPAAADAITAVLVRV